MSRKRPHEDEFFNQGTSKQRKVEVSKRQMANRVNATVAEFVKCRAKSLLLILEQQSSHEYNF